MMDTLSQLKPYHKLIEILEATLGTNFALMDSMSLCIMIVDENSRILHANASALRRLQSGLADGTHCESLIGKPLLSLVDTSVAESFQEYFSFHRRYPDGSRTSIIDRSCEDQEILWQMSPLALHQFERIHNIAVIGTNTNDLQSSYKAEILRMAKMASICTLSKGLSEEFRKPLELATLATENLDIALDGVPEAKMAIETLNSAMKRMNGIVDNLEDFGNASHSEQPEAQSLNGIINNFFDYKKAILESNQIELKLHLSTYIPEVFCARKDIDMVMHILLCHCLDDLISSGHGSRQITISTYLTGRNNLVFEMSHNAKVDNPSFSKNGDGATPRHGNLRVVGKDDQEEEEKASAMSLSVLYSILAKIGSELDVASTENGGAQFRITFREIKNVAGF